MRPASATPIDAAVATPRRNQPLIVNLVANDGHSDSRVLKAAKAALVAGFRPLILADGCHSTPAERAVDGIVLRHFDARDRKAPPVLRLERQLFPRNLDQRRFAARHRRLQVRLMLARLQKLLTLPNGGEMLRRERKAVEARLYPFVFRRHLVYLRNLARAWSWLGSGETPAIIHAHDLFTLPAGVWLADATGARLIYDAHEYEPGRYNASQGERDSFAALEDRAFQAVDRLVTVGKAIGDLYAARFSGPTPTVIYNAPVMGKSGLSPNLRARCGLGSEKLIVYTGLVHGAGRGLDVLLRALVMLEDVHLAVLGRRDARYDRWLLDQTGDSSLTERVHLLDPVSPDKVVGTIGDADLGICLIQDVAPSYRLAMPNKLFEMTLAGLPVIVSNLPELASFIRQFGHGEIVEPTDWAALADAIRRVIANRDAYVLTPQAKLRLKAEYGVDAQIERLGELYRELAPVS